jgi:hypothetical protein
MISRCPVQNDSYPKYFFSACSILSNVKRFLIHIDFFDDIYHIYTALVRKIGTRDQDIVVSQPPILHNLQVAMLFIRERAFQADAPRVVRGW